MIERITITGLKKRFDNVELYENFHLAFEQGKITTLFGPNGSGKSTLLNILSGLEEKDDGVITGEIHPHTFSYIFQNYRESLLPWKRNRENIALPLVFQKKDPAFIEDRLQELEGTFGDAFDWNAYPYQLSGGQQQCVAFLRAIITKPTLLFIDEPFSALDYANNLKLREYIQTYYLAHTPTVILVTHNVEEAVHLSHSIVVLSPRPTGVAARVPHPIPFPRSFATLTSQEFHATKSEVLNAFRGCSAV